MTEQNSLLGKVAAYTEILVKDPQSTIFVSLGEAYRKMGMLDDARLVIEKGLLSHTDFSPAHIVLARILCQQGEYPASEKSFQNALQHDKESLAALVGYARLNILQGKEREARELLIKARELSPADPVINKLLLSLPEAEVKVEAEEPAPEAVAQEPDDDLSVDFSESDTDNSEPPLASSTLADLYLKQGLTDQALEMYRKLSIDEPDNLLYRRKIRDIEEDIEGTGSQQIDAVIDAVIDQPEVEEKAEVTIADVSAMAQEQAGSDSFSADEQAVAVLNRWLDSIKQRREDV